MIRLNPLDLAAGRDGRVSVRHERGVVARLERRDARDWQPIYPDGTVGAHYRTRWDALTAITNRLNRFGVVHERESDGNA